jgi:hypothetical protein
VPRERSKELELRGATVARVLAGAWRAEPAPVEVSRQEVGSVTDVLLESGSGALAWYRLRGTPAGDGEAGDRLESAYRWHAARTALRARELRAVITALGEVRVPALLFKGFAAGRLYPEQGLRPFGDIDLLVPPDDVEAARRAVSSARPTCDVDVHGHGRRGERADFARLLARSEVVELDGVEVRILGPEDHLRALSIHLLRHGAWRPLWLCDVAALIEARAASLDWDDCLRRPNNVYAEWVRAVVGLAHELLGATGAPPSWTDAKPRWLRSAVLRQWGIRGSIYPRLAQRPFEQRPAGGRRLLAAAATRWPTPLEATTACNWPLRGSPRPALQAGVFAFRTGRFAFRLTTGARSLSASA